MRIQPWTEKALMAHEDVFEELTARAVAATMDSLRRKLLSGGPLVAAAGDAVSLPTPPPETAPPVSFTAVEGAVMATWTQQVNEVLYPFLTGTFVESAASVVEGIAAGVGKVVEPLTNVYASEYLQFAHNRMVGIGQVLWEKLRATMVEGFQAGLGIKEIAANLSEVGGLSTPRALTTARTEVIGAANGGSYSQMLAAGFDDSEVTKVWLATEDTRTRKSHRHADNQGVELTGEFTLDIYNGDVKTGTEGLEFPGDPTGTPGNVINCRCSLAFDFNENEIETPMTAASFFSEKLHPRDEHGKFTKKGSVTKLFKELSSADKAAAIVSMTEKDWHKLSAEDKAGLVAGVEDISSISTKKLVKKKLKDLGASTNPDAGWSPGDPKPNNDSSSLAKTQYLIHHGLDGMEAGQVNNLVKVIKQKDWDKLSEDEKGAVAAKVDSIMHPVISESAEKSLADLKAGEGPGALNVKQAVEKLAKEAAGPARPQGGKDTKSGKELVPGKPVKLRVQLLYNTTFEDGAVMAVRKDSDERIVWQNGKILRQKKGADGKFSTIDTKTRGDAYKAWKDEDGWTVPDATPAAVAPAGAATAASVGKPTSIKVQLVYQTPFNDGDTVAVNPGTGQKITWDAPKKRMVVHEADGTSKEYTRGALYKEFKDSTGWHLPGKEDEAAPAVAEVPSAKKLPKIVVDEIISEAAPEVNGQTVFENDDFEISASKSFLLVESKKGTGYAQLLKADITPDKLTDVMDKVAAGEVVKEKKATPQTPGEKAVSAYNASGPNNAFYDQDGIVMVKSSSGNVIIGKKAGDNFGGVKAADMTPENVEKSIAAINAGKTWGAGEPIPGVDTTPDAPKTNNITASDPAVGLKFTGKTVGTHKAKIYQGPDGKQLLFKPNPSGFSAAAEVDLATAKLHEEFGFITPETSIVSLDGQKGSLQAMFPNAVSSPPSKFNAAVLEDYEVIDIQKEHIFDWLVANHDAHSDNLLKVPSEPGLIGIDKGQAFKWFGGDKLSTDFNPNEHTQAANVLYKAYAEGVPGVNIKGAGYWEINGVLNAIQDMPDEEFKAILRPMAQAMAKDGKLGLQGPAHLGLKKPPFPPNDVEAFLNAAVARKNSIKADYTKFLDDLKIKHDLATGAVATPVPTALPTATSTSISTLPSPGQKALKLGPSVLTGPTSTKYAHGQVIAHNPSQGERIVWNAHTKKYDVQTPDANGVWTTGFSYNKSAALKNLKDDPGWYTPAPGQSMADPGAPSVSGSPTAPSIGIPGSPAVPAKTATEKQAQAGAAISGLTTSQKTELFNAFKQVNGAVYLSSPPEQLFAKALKVQKSFNNDHNTKLSALAVMMHADEATASKLGVANAKSYEKKVADWLQTPAGAKKAALLLEDERLTADEKAAKAAAAAAAVKAKTEKDLATMHAVKVSTPQKTTSATKFTVLSVADAKIMGATMQAAQPWSASEKAALKKYTGSYYSELNNALRGKQELTPQNIKDATNIQKGMRPIPQDIILHRGLGAVPGILPGNISDYSALIGKTFQEPGFTSTSVGGKAAFGGKIKLTIEAPKGTPGAWLDDISSHHGEREVLLAANTKFQILEATQSPDGYSIDVRVRIVP